jgi:16S rRNA (uracil1498-N3)-methyltransferase
MARRRFFVNEVRRGEASIEGQEAEHLTRVLRVEIGQRYEICDGSRLFLAEIVEARTSSVRFQVIEALEVDEPEVRVSLLMSLIKFERFEWMIEKTTELGVDTIVPVQTDRSEKGLELAARKRVDRWAQNRARGGAAVAARFSAPDFRAGESSGRGADSRAGPFLSRGDAGGAVAARGGDGAPRPASGTERGDIRRP